MPDRRPVRIANFSGFFGDRRGAARLLLDGPDPIDVLTGDYLAELTMLILWKTKQRDPSAGYAATFLAEMAGIIDDCRQRGIKVVTNAGGLNPAGLATKLRELTGSSLQVAVVEGDDLVADMDRLVAGARLRPFEGGGRLRGPGPGGDRAVTANAYLGGWGVAAALAEGADIVVTGRITDASLVVGPSAWWHGWDRRDFDRLAGAVVAGHVIECGAQTTGGNYSFLDELPDLRYPGFPIAEIAADGSSVITKQPGTGGMVTTGTVTAQLLYEIASPAYANPDAVADFSSIRLDQSGPDRVRISGVRGGPPPETLKVSLNYDGGFRNSMTLVLTGLDRARKAERAVAQLTEVLGGTDQFEDFSVELVDSARDDAPSNALATSLLRINVRDPDPTKVGRQFSNAVVALALASYGGFYTTTPPQSESAYGIYVPALVDAGEVHQTVVLGDGRRIDVAHTPGEPWSDLTVDETAAAGSDEPVDESPPDHEPCEIVPLGRLCGARSGDKGGNANVGLWTRTDATFEWLDGYLTAGRLRRLLGAEAEGLEIRRYRLPNLRALNFVVVGLLGEGVASSARYDPQAKGLGEYLRSRTVEVPDRLLR